MEAGQIRIVYDGLDADRHEVDMRLFGRSMIGIDKIVSDSLIYFTEQRRPRKGERAPLVIHAQPPVEGSAEVFGALAPAVGALPLVWDFLNAGAGDILWRSVSWVLDYHGGRRSQADRQLDVIASALRQSEKARSKTEERWLESESQWRAGMFDLVHRLLPAAKNAVAPVGPSVESLRLGGSGEAAAEVDVPMAEAIRHPGDVEVGDLETMVVRVDGFQHHNKTLKIERPDAPGSYMTADVRDPAFDEAPNIYTQAAEQKAQLVITGKKALRSQKLERIYIFHASEILPEAA
ncbi:MAG: hypothetical protein J0I69_03310 [Altererythrobacter sp.]|nr:hypothetical protein [Altererythrobacter sp.]OJU61026.1 MAG: hypothetical protein BGO08_13035 [Altererythrobacter sp. 66-12]